MQPGFLLFIDEAGDEGIEKVRPQDANGASEWFVLCGVLIRLHRHPELLASLNRAKAVADMTPDDELHFRDLSDPAQLAVIRELANFNAGLLAVVSNKRNMRGYRNRRVEAKNMELRRGRMQPQNYNYFYNHLFRYLLETASKECARWTNQIYRANRSISIIFSHRRDFRYSQTSAYLFKMKTRQHSPMPFNNRHQVEWSVVDPKLIESKRARAEPGLQFADCIASAIYKAVDEDRFETVVPEFIELLGPRLLKGAGAATAAGYGFKLVPDTFRGPVSTRQAQGLRAAGFNLKPQPEARASHPQHRDMRF